MSKKGNNVFVPINRISTDRNYKYSEGKEWFEPYLTIRFFSLFSDTVLYASEVNKSYFSERGIFDYLVKSVSKRKRFTKWPKKEMRKQEQIQVIQEYFQINQKKAKEYLKILSEKEIEEIQERMIAYNTIEENT